MGGIPAHMQYSAAFQQSRGFQSPSPMSVALAGQVAVAATQTSEAPKGPQMMSATAFAASKVHSGSEVAGVQDKAKADIARMLGNRHK